MVRTRRVNYFILLAIALLSVPPLRAQSARPVEVQGKGLTQEQKAGMNLFLQNCSFCHLERKENPKSTAEGERIGPQLKGMLSGPKPVLTEQVARNFILRGTQKMPGFQYGLEPKEIDSIIAYLKTL